VILSLEESHLQEHACSRILGAGLLLWILITWVCAGVSAEGRMLGNTLSLLGGKRTCWPALLHHQTVSPILMPSSCLLQWGGSAMHGVLNVLQPLGHVVWWCSQPDCSNHMSLSSIMPTVAKTGSKKGLRCICVRNRLSHKCTLAECCPGNLASAMPCWQKDHELSACSLCPTVQRNSGVDLVDAQHDLSASTSTR